MSSQVGRHPSAEPAVRAT